MSILLVQCRNLLLLSLQYELLKKDQFAEMAYIQLIQTLKAAANDGERRSGPIKPKDLDIYREPVVNATSQVQGSELNPPNLILNYVSQVRRKVWRFKDVTIKTYDKMEGAVLDAKQGVLSGYEKAISDPLSMLRPGCITAAVLAGAIVQGRGRKPFLRLTSATIAGTLVASVAYPDKALLVAKEGYYKAKDTSLSLVEKMKKLSSETSKEINEMSVEDKNKLEAESSTYFGSKEQMSDAGIDTTKQADMESLHNTDPIVVLDAKGEEICLLDASKIDDEIVANTENEHIHINSSSVTEEATGEINSDVLGKDLQIRDDMESVISDEKSAIMQKNFGENQLKNDEIEASQNSDSLPELFVDYGQSHPDDKDMYSTRS